jgi:hypothetical protein
MRLTPQSRCGKNFVMGFTPLRRPIIYFFPSRNTTPVDQRRAIHAVSALLLGVVRFQLMSQIFLLERARDLMPTGTSYVSALPSLPLPQTCCPTRRFLAIRPDSSHD